MITLISQTKANATGALMAPTTTAIAANIHVRPSRLKSAKRESRWSRRDGDVAFDIFLGQFLRLIPLSSF